MSISLNKGQNISLKKAASESGSYSPLSKIQVFLSWDERVTDGADFDVDASAFLLDANGKITTTADFIFYGQLAHTSGAVIHQGDDSKGLNGEEIVVDLTLLPVFIHKIAFVVTIHEATQRNQNFGMISNATITIVNTSDNKEICRYELSEDASTETAMIFSEIYKNNDEWKIKAVGQGFVGGLASLCINYDNNSKSLSKALGL